MRNAHLMIKTIVLINITTHADGDVPNTDKDISNDHLYLSFSAGSPQLLISVAIMNSLMIINTMTTMMMQIMMMMMVVVAVMNLEVDGSVSVLIKDPEQLVQVLLPSCPLPRSSHSSSPSWP